MAKDNWETPRELFDALDKEFEFGLDVCADFKNAKCFFHIDKDRDSLSGDWYACGLSNIPPICWMNPPYSRGNIDRFCKKAYEESQKGCTVVGLLPLRSAGWFHEYVMKAHEIRYLKRRVRFIDPDTGERGGSPTFDSIIVVWRPGHTGVPVVSSYDW